MRLQENPFYILGVSITDNRNTIEDAVEDKCFDEPEREEEFERAKGILLNPQHRIQAEMTWFPGVFYHQEKEIREAIEKKRKYNFSEENALFQLNFILWSLNGRDLDKTAYDIGKIDELYGDVEVDDLITWLNDSRGISKFPVVQNRDAVQSAWDEMKNIVHDHLQELVSSLNQNEYQDLMLKFVRRYLVVADNAGSIARGFLADYKLSVEQQMMDCADKIDELAEKLKTDPQEGTKNAICADLEKLAFLARPMNVLAVAKNEDEFPYVAHSFNTLEDICLEVWKNHPESYKIVMELVEKLSVVFADIPEVRDRCNRYLKDMREVIAERNKPVPVQTQNTAPLQNNSSSSPKTTSSSTPTESSSNDSNAGCGTYLFFGVIGAFIGGPIGFFIGLWLASKTSDD